MRRQLMLFAADVNRYSPLAIIVLATLACTPSLCTFLGGDLDLTTMLVRYAFALLLATVAVRVLSRLIVRYAVRNLLVKERGAAAPSVPPPSR